LTQVTDAEEKVVSHCGLPLYADQGTCTKYFHIKWDVNNFKFWSS